MIRLRGGQVLTFHQDEITLERHDVLIDGSLIAAVGSPADIDPAVQGQEVQDIDASDKLIMPGLINAHAHSSDSLLKGTWPLAPLEVWSLYSHASRWGRSNQEIYLSAALAAVEALRSGTTTLLDHIRLSPQLRADGLEAAARAYLQVGIRAVIAPVVADRPAAETLPIDPGALPADLAAALRQPGEPAETQLETCHTFFRAWQGRDQRTSLLIGPSAIQRCTDHLLAGCAALADECNVGVHTHFLETYPQRVVANCLYPQGAAAHLRDMGLLGQRTALAHSVWASRADLEVIAASGAVLVHCPLANLRLGSGLLPWRAARQVGVALALGTDGVGCNDSLSVFEVMKAAALLHRAPEVDPVWWPTPAQVLRAATQGGAAACGLGAQLGAIAPGRKADLVLLRRSASSLTPLHNPAAQLVLSESGQAVDTVLVDGKIALTGGLVTGLDEAALRDEAQEAARDLLARNAPHYQRADALRPYLEQLVRQLQQVR